MHQPLGVCLHFVKCGLAASYLEAIAVCSLFIHSSFVQSNLCSGFETFMHCSIFEPLLKITQENSSFWSKNCWALETMKSLVFIGRSPQTEPECSEMGLSLAHCRGGGWRPTCHSSVYFHTYYKQELKRYSYFITCNYS